LRERRGSSPGPGAPSV